MKHNLSFPPPFPKFLVALCNNNSIIIKVSILLSITVTTPFLLIGCATPPQMIPPANVSSIPYKDLSCQELIAEQRIEQEKVEALTKRRRGARRRDIALNVLVLPGLGAATGNSEDELARAKGRIDAIDKLIATKCVIKDKPHSGNQSESET